MWLGWAQASPHRFPHWVWRFSSLTGRQGRSGGRQIPADPSPCRARGGVGGSGQATGPRYLSPTKFLTVDFFCEQKCDFFL